MGRFCAGFGKLASCFCFTSKDKIGTEAETNGLPSGDSVLVRLANNCANSGPSAEPWCSRNLSNNNPNDNMTKSVLSENISSSRDHNDGEDQKVEWISGARKEVTVISWKVQDFLALCELKELLRNETLIFTAGHSLNKPTRWCFNLQRMKNEDNIGLFLKRLPPLSFKDAISNTVGLHSGDIKNGAVVASKNNGSVNGNGGAIVAAANEHTLPNLSNGEINEEEPVYIHYECMIKRSGYGDVWIHKRTCIPNFDIEQRLGFRKLFTMEDLKLADDISKPKFPPLLGENNSLHLDIKFTLHLKSLERTREEMSMMENFSLDWTVRYHSELLKEELKRLLISGANSDLVLIVEADNDEKTFMAHRSVLAARSPVFAAMLHSGMQETSSGIIRIKDDKITPRALQSILCYMYSGAIDEEINWSDVGEVQDLIYAADKYSLLGLRDYCDKMMFTGCENSNAVELLYLAQMHSLRVATKEISLFIKMNANEIFSG